MFYLKFNKKRIVFSVILTGVLGVFQTHVQAESPPPKDHAEKSEKPAKKEREPISPEAEEEAARIISAESFILSPNYVYRWVNFPSLEGENINQKTEKINPELGYVSVAFFLATWCIPCQEILEDFKKIEAKYKDKPVHFYYVFSHDVKPDILGFQKEFTLADNILIANHDILKKFHNPQLPTIYVGDRHKFLLTRYVKPTSKELTELDTLLKYLTVY